MQKWIKLDAEHVNPIMVEWSGSWHWVTPVEKWVLHDSESDSNLMRFKISAVGQPADPDYMPMHYRIQSVNAPDVAVLTTHKNALIDFEGSYTPKRLTRNNEYIYILSTALDWDIVLLIGQTAMTHKKGIMNYRQSDPIGATYAGLSYRYHNVLGRDGTIQIANSGLDHTYSKLGQLFGVTIADAAVDPVPGEYRYRQLDDRTPPLQLWNDLDDNTATYTPTAYDYSYSLNEFGQYSGTAGSFTVGYFEYSIDGAGSYVLDIDITYNDDIMKWFFTYTDGKKYYSATRPTESGGTFSDEDPEQPTILTLDFENYVGALTDEYYLLNERPV
jgi:hypothetical protein